MLGFEVASRSPVAFFPFGQGTSIGPCAMEALSILLGGKKYTDNPEGVNYDLACLMATVNDNLFVSPEERAGLLWRYLPSLIGTADLVPRRFDMPTTPETAFPMRTLLEMRGDDEEGINPRSLQTPMGYLIHLRRTGVGMPSEEMATFLGQAINALYEYKNATPRRTDFTTEEVHWLRMHTAMTRPSAVRYSTLPSPVNEWKVPTPFLEKELVLA